MSKPTPADLICAITDLPGTDSEELASELGCTTSELEEAMSECDPAELQAAFAGWPS